MKQFSTKLTNLSEHYLGRSPTSFERSARLVKRHYLSEQELPPGGAPPSQGPGTPPTAPAEPEPAPAEPLNKPYNVLAYIAYRALMLDPAEISESTAFRHLQDKAGDIGDRGDIKTPEQGLEILVAIEELLNSLDTPESI